ncbi:Crossover junction endodeoxyribonuclease, RusA-like [uncultured Caudovirales phage]|uniref:Crossover junction endodeoxyribonuclease, RusA-like n=1 Tax=uncultured Caudovirales phage TaxID=2100421 RepID=A0A6J5L3C9_9CAUD|nr:Crossover junction endodeoxyribonuclease, RusA-like [uncultured Caudovirales phage]
MTLIVTFEVEGDPVPKSRPRFARRGNFVQTYTDAKTIDYETHVAMKARQAIGASEPLQGALTVFLYLRYLIPASYSKKRKEACLRGVEYPKKIDIDNVYKSITDAMNGIVYTDDSQIVEAHIKKVYAETAGANIMVQECE